MQFNRREILLIVACLFFLVGLMAVLETIYAIIITLSIYFGIKFLVGKRKKMIQADVGAGICADCGEKLDGGSCKNCSESEK